jgi:hypothetical protein
MGVSVRDGKVLRIEGPNLGSGLIDAEHAALESARADLAIARKRFVNARNKL